MISKEWIHDANSKRKVATHDETQDANLKANQLLKLPLTAWKRTDVPGSVSIAYLVDAIDKETKTLEKFIAFCELKKDTSFDHFAFIMAIGTTIKHVYGWKEVGE